MLWEAGSDMASVPSAQVWGASFGMGATESHPSVSNQEEAREQMPPIQ